MVLIAILLLLNVLNFCSWVRNEKLRELSYSPLFFFRRKHVWYSYFVLFMFIFTFIFLFRIVRIFLSQKKYFDTYIFYGSILNLTFYEKFFYFLVFFFNYKIIYWFEVTFVQFC